MRQNKVLPASLHSALLKIGKEFCYDCLVSAYQHSRAPKLTYTF